MKSYKKWLLILLPCVLAVGVIGAIWLKASTQGAPRLVVQLGHSGSISSAVYSPDGRFIVSGGVEDQVAILWEAATGREIRRFVGHKAPINSVAFSPDSRFILTGSGHSEFEESEAKDYTARLWDIATGEEVRRFEGHTGAINSVAFSPDGHLILTGSDDKTARLSDTQTGKEVKKLGQITSVQTVAYSPNGQVVMTGAGRIRGDEDGRCEDCTAVLWNPNTGNAIRKFGAHASPIKSVAFSSDGRLALTAEEQNINVFPSEYDELKKARQWEVDTGKEIHTYGGFSPAIFSPNGQFVVTGGAGPNMADAQIWNASTGQRLHSIQGHFSEVLRDGTRDGNVRYAAFSPDGQSFLIVFGTNAIANAVENAGETTIYVFDTASKIKTFALGKLSEDIFNVDFPIKGNGLIQTGNSVWDTKTGMRQSFDEVKQQTGNGLQEAGYLQRLSRDGRLALGYTIDRSLMSAGTGSIDSLMASNGEIVTLWDVDTGKLLNKFGRGYAADLSSDNRMLLTESFREIEDSVATLDGGGVRITLWDIKTRQARWSYKKEVILSGVVIRGLNSSLGNCLSRFSEDGRFVLVSLPESNSITILNSMTGSVIREINIGNDRSSSTLFSFSKDLLLGRFLTVNDGNSLLLYEAKSGSLGSKIKLSHHERHEVFSADSTLIATSLPNSESNALNSARVLKIWNSDNGSLVKQFPVVLEAAGLSSAVSFSPENRHLLTFSNSDKPTAYLWDVSTGKELHKLQLPSQGTVMITQSTFSPDGRFVLTGNTDGTTRIWNIETGQELCRLVSLHNGDWIVTTPDGRFDTNNLEEIKGLHWIMPNDPLKPQPLEIFMRQYYEPRLLARVLAGEQFKPLPKLSELNRAQPEVKITDIKQDSAETLEVSVLVANAKSTGQKSFFGKPLESGVYDLRLFRNGQLAGYTPENDGEVKLNTEGKATLKFSKIKLPRTDVEQVEFSAYAFNTDRVKSATSRKIYKLTPKPAPIKGRAYLIRLGVNAYEREGLNLRYAATDARRADDLATRLAVRGEFLEVVSLPLISDYTVTLADGRTLAANDATPEQVRAGRKRVTENTATKAHLRAVLDVLAGREADAALLKQIPNADKLRAARPEDLVLISASSHGYTDSDGIFYLVPSDSGTADLKSPEFRRRCVSSDELSRWLRDVDAGELVLIVDACHSAAAIEGTDFKPGPMGSRGLGQLSYDKGMRILTATQADNVALEKGGLGLLMRALLVDGLMGWQADYKPRDKSILLTEWLGYSVDRVPRLYEEMKDGRIRGTFDPRELADSKTQQPALFDFARRRRDVVLARQP